MIFVLAAVLNLIFVHGPGGQEIELNVNQISSVQFPRGEPGHFAKGTQCLVFMTNGKFTATQETCLDVLKMIAALAP